MKNITKRNYGFTLVELLVVIAIIALLLSVLMPSLTKARQQAQRVVCSTNLHQWHLALDAYSADNKGRLPHIYSCVYPYGLNMPKAIQTQNGATQTVDYFGYAVYPYLTDNKLSRCPANKTWKNYKEFNMWAVDQAGKPDRDGWYMSQYSFFIDSPIHGTTNYDYSFASAHGYIKEKVPLYNGQRRGNLLLAQDVTYAIKTGSVYRIQYPDLSLFNHAKGIPEDDAFKANKLSYMRTVFGGANSLYLQGNVKWTTGVDLTCYAIPGNGIVGYLFFPSNGPGRYPAR